MIGGEDLVVGDGREPPVRTASCAATAAAHDAGAPMRIAVAIVSGCFTGSPSTSGAAPAAWVAEHARQLVEISPSAWYSV